MKLTKCLKSWLTENAGVAATASDAEFVKAAHTALDNGKLSATELATLLGEVESDADLVAAVADGVADRLKGGPTSKQVFARVKGAGERYSTTKSVGKHSKSGLPVRDERGREVETPSELELAKAGALLKFAAGRAGISAPLSDHERDLLGESFAKDAWCGRVGSEYVSDLPGVQAKALLDDSTSGGLEIVPVWFDNLAVSFPLLGGELYPFVDLQEVPRGRRVEGASIGNPTLSWGNAEGSAITPFTTDSLVSAIDTTIYPVTAAVEVGRDFLSDSPVAVGSMLTASIGQRLAEELDDCIANGSGTDRPQGIFVASGVTDVGNPGGGSGAVPTIEDYLTLLFAVGKQYRNRAYNPCFIANDTSYRRIRAVKTGVTGDSRLVAGMDVNSYALLDWPFRVQNDIPNARHAFGCLRKYRMYRRQGLTIEWTKEGRTLGLANEALLLVRGRFGGKVVDANAFAKQTHAQA